MGLWAYVLIAKTKGGENELTQNILTRYHSQQTFLIGASTKNCFYYFYYETPIDIPC